MKIVGIDLGTTYSAVAVIEDGEPRIIPTAEGERLCPSVVAWSKSGERLVGRMARRQAATNPENTIFSIKRLMGRRADDAAVVQARLNWPYRILGGPGGDARVYLPQSGRAYTPQEISAMVLHKLKEDAEAYLGERVTHAVITVPAYFNDSQRQATRDAGQIAGLEVLRIVNEPTAASLAYGLHGRGMETIMVFDLGGGTFDVSILEVGEGMVEVRATSGDTFLGGDDWDRRIVDHVLARFMQEHGIDLRQDSQAWQRLLEAAEKARIDLSTVIETEINLPFITADRSGPRHLHVPLTRARLEQLTTDLVQRCVGPVERALRDAGLAASDLDQVVLVGGATRMPMIQDLVRRLTGHEPSRSRSPDELVAIGAAVQAGVLAGEVHDVLLLDVTPLTLGVETADGRMAPLIERNATVPVRKSEIFSTAEDNQTAVTVHVLQGEQPLAADNMSLGRFHLEGIPAAPRGVPQIEVAFDLDANGILSVSARDNATGSRQAVTVSASTSLGREEMERMVREARQHEAEDRRRRELAQARNDADVIVFEIERVLRNLGARVPPADRSRIERTIGELQVVKEGGSTLRIRQLIEYLQQARYALGRLGAAQGGPHPARDQDAAGDGLPTA